MTGPELLAKGLELLASAQDADPGADPADVLVMLRFAEVHFAAAQVEATVDAGLMGMPMSAQRQWTAAIEGEQQQAAAPSTSIREYGVRVGDMTLPYDDLHNAIESAEYGGVVVARTVTVTPWVPVDPAEISGEGGS